MHLGRLAGRTAAVLTLTGVGFVGSMAAGGGAQAWDAAVWDRVAACESSGNWAINTGNGYYGGLQFAPATWTGFGGQEYAAYAHQASKAEQIAVARRVLFTQGPGAWPTCSVRAGLTKENGGADRYAQPEDSPAADPLVAKDPPTASAPIVTDDAVLADGTVVPARLVEDGVLGRATIRAMQDWLGVAADGIWGRQTTRALQARVGATVDGVRGRETPRKTQELVGATPDGIWGRQTTRALQHHLNQQAT